MAGLLIYYVIIRAMAKIFKTGNSLVVTIPSHFVGALGLKAGDTVQVKSTVENGQILYQFSGVRQLPLVEEFTSRPRKKKK